MRELLQRNKMHRKSHESICFQVLKEGFWVSKEDAESKIAKKSNETSRKDAVKLQLRFRKVVLKQAGDKSLFQFSAKGTKTT